LLLTLCACISVSAQQTSQQEKRVVPEITGKGRKLALVVGNKSYTLRPLTNPLNDADDMKAALEAVGFHVDILKDANKAQLETEIDSFTQSLQEGDIVFFYYSGHGIAIQNQNYLIPVDFTGANEASVRYNTTSADYVQQAIEDRRPQLTILVLDACRDNPFIRSKGVAGGGLAPMREAKGTLIAFAAGPGEAAIDTADQRNSLYTKYLLGALQQPGLSVRDLFDQVAEQVHEASGEKILPSVNRQLVGDFVFRPVDRQAEESKRRFADIRDTRDPALLETFIRDYPDQPDTPLAEARLKQLTQDRLAQQQQAEQARLRKEDDDFWNSVKGSTQPAMIDLYVNKFPSGLHAAEAARLRGQLVTRQNELARQTNAQAFQSKDDTAWEFARATNSKAGADQYLKDFPTGAHAADAAKLRDQIAARERQAELQQTAQVFRAQEDAAWDVARNANSKPVLEAYLQKFGTGLHAAEARDLIAKLPDRSVAPPVLPGNPHPPYRNPRDKSEYVWVPGGTFQAGCRKNDTECGPDEPRPHQVALPDAGFWLGRTEVTVQAYKLFVEAEKRKMPSPSDDNHKWEFTDHPMIKVSWEQAKSYCEWVGGRLPAGDEWERAARGGTDTRYPWGDEIRPNQAKYIKSPSKTGAVTAPVKSFEPNGYGLFDVAGNVWEWTSDLGAKGVHQTRGGSWYSAAKDLHVTSVRSFKSDEGVNEVGFRCLLPRLPPDAAGGQ
jgi:formylglycine-generating enzyme required for sulfatase activity